MRNLRGYFFQYTVNNKGLVKDLKKFEQVGMQD